MPHCPTRPSLVRAASSWPHAWAALLGLAVFLRPAHHRIQSSVAHTRDSGDSAMTPHHRLSSLSRLLWRVSTASLVLLLGSLAPLVHAACSPILPPPVRYVGPVGVGSQCTDSTIQEAIDNSTCAYGTTIYLSPYGLGGTRTYSNQHLSINNKTVTLIGESGTYGCGSPPPYCGEMFSDPNNCLNFAGPVITLDGNNTNGSVIQISGNSHVALKYLEITRGVKNGSGGGISFLGTGSLSLLSSSVLSNQATYGGGIDVTTSGGDLTLNLYDNVTVGTNGASESGGGVRIQSDGNAATLNAASSRLLIANNEATNGYGGGVELVGHVTAYIGSPGVPGVGTIALNRAVRGGGIAALASDGEQAEPVLHLFSTDVTTPIRVGSNTATQTGGGLFLKPRQLFSGTIVGAKAYLWDFQIDNNIAQNGTAIYVDVFDHLLGLSGTADYINLRINDGIRPVGSVMCVESARCNAISSNIAQNASGARTSGSVILLQEFGHLAANRFRMEKNVANYAINGVNSNDMVMTNCLVADNDLNLNAVIHDSGGGVVKLKGCTVANNSIAGNLPNTYIVDIGNSGANVELFGNIFAQPSVNTNSIKFSGTNLTSTFNLAREIGTLGGVINANIAGAPSFVDAALGNYHLQSFSSGVDVAPNLGGDDLAGRARDIDRPGVTNGTGTRDLGAFELGCGPYLPGALCSLDVDGNDTLDGTDSVMMLRRLFGFSTASLRSGQPSGVCLGRRTTAQIESFVQDQLTPKAALGNLAAWDIDGNGKVDALTDGLLVLRVVLGLTGTSVTNKAIGNNSPARSDWTDVRSYLNGTCGMTLP